MVTIAGLRIFNQAYWSSQIIAISPFSRMPAVYTDSSPGFARRCAALAYDSLLLAALWLAVSALVLALSGGYGLRNPTGRCGWFTSCAPP